MSSTSRRICVIGCSRPRGMRSPGRVTSMLSPSASAKPSAADSLRGLVLCLLELRAQLVQRLAGLPVADLAQRLRQVGPAPEVADVDVVQLVERGGRLVSRDGFRLVGLPVHVGDCIAWLSHCLGPGCRLRIGRASAPVPGEKPRPGKERMRSRRGHG